MQEKPSEKNDIFFDLYRINIACYYNSKTILKLLNETTNISRNVNEILQTYEDNSSRIKKFDNKTYNEHFVNIKCALCRLFQEKQKKKSIFEDFNSKMSQFKSLSYNIDLKSYIEKLSEKLSHMVPDIKMPRPNENKVIEVVNIFANKTTKPFKDLSKKKMKENKRSKEFNSFVNGLKLFE